MQILIEGDLPNAPRCRHRAAGPARNAALPPCLVRQDVGSRRDEQRDASRPRRKQAKDRLIAAHERTERQARFSARRKNFPARAAPRSPEPSAQPTGHGSARLSGSRTVNRHRCQPVRVGSSKRLMLPCSSRTEFGASTGGNSHWCSPVTNLNRCPQPGKSRRIPAPHQHAFAIEFGGDAICHSPFRPPPASALKSPAT